jgi:hypothetical protein
MVFTEDVSFSKDRISLVPRGLTRIVLYLCRVHMTLPHVVSIEGGNELSGAFAVYIETRHPDIFEFPTEKRKLRLGISLCSLDF